MQDALQFYINGEWVDPAEGATTLDVINPATEQAFGRISIGTSADVDRAVAAAKAAFPAFAETSKEERIELMERVIAAYKAHYGDMARAISMEMGAPMSLAKGGQAGSGLGHLYATLKALKEMDLEEELGGTMVVREPVGVCGFITPWNWPVNQIACKVAPALAAGCTMVLKPSEIAPFSAIVWTEIMHEAGVPAGVYNLVNGDGPGVGATIASHPDIDMVSFTGSTRAGTAVAAAAAPTVKRVAQELGGKSANIILDDADFAKAVRGGVEDCFHNTGQSCNSPTRMLVPVSRMDEVIAIAKETAAGVKPGDPKAEDTDIGPVVSDLQWGKIQGLINAAVDEGTDLIVGGPGKPEGLDTGYYVRPTIFANVTNDMTIAREEVFGPVLAILGYEDEDQAVEIANDTPYGLSGYISSGDIDRARAVARRLRTGMVHLNGADTDIDAPFGGYKQSGNGREWGKWGLEDFLETKAIMGYKGS